MTNKFKEALSYDDVLLVPQFSDIISRSEIKLDSNLGDVNLTLPIIASPMDTISEEAMAIEMDFRGGMAIVHRYNSIERQTKIVKNIVEADALVGAAIGTTDDYLDRAHALVEAGVDVLCVDTAHGHHQLMKNALKNLCNKFKGKVHIMAGNVAGLEGYEDLASWGADSVRCGIGGGCFVPGTIVHGPDGKKVIENIQIGDQVFSHTGKSREVIDTLTFQRNEEIIVVNGIECTSNHEFYVINIDDANRATEKNIHRLTYWAEANYLDPDLHLLVEIGQNTKFELIKISNIERKQYKGTVHDLTVETDHSYNVGGIIVHNSICSTRIQTGHGLPGLQTIIDCKKSHWAATVPIIADGGLRNSGDIVKALAAGADFVIVGSLLSGTDETPGEVIHDRDGKFKTYRGMASKDAQMDWRGRAASLEGIATRVSYKGPVSDVLLDLERGIRSGLSYTGVRTIQELQENARFARQTVSGQMESSTHILYK